MCRGVPDWLCADMRLALGIPCSREMNILVRMSSYKAFFGSGRQLSGQALVLVAEHPKELGDAELAMLAKWTYEDLERMSRFRHRASKTSWCVARRLFDDTVFELEGVEDAHGQLVSDGFGKPELPGGDLRFNWSHSSGCVALAITYGQGIGVDIERMGRPRGDYFDIARHYFTDEERAWIEGAPDDESWRRFISLFVQKEAWLKKTGQGLSCPLTTAPASLCLPPARSPGRILTEVGRRNDYIVAVDASGSQSDTLDICIEQCILDGLSLSNGQELWVSSQ